MAGARPFEGSRGWKAVDSFYKEFEKGTSAVINSLNEYDPSSRRFADSFIEGARYPVEVYMYLTPPLSQSYNYHLDVMDAWMIQLHGEKKWSMCDRFTSRKKYSADVCTNYTMNDGDVMFVPFRTIHYAWTEEQLSSHLTVNVERQHYVWGSALVSGLRHRACSNMGLIDAAGKVHFEGYSGEGADAEIEEKVVQLFSKIPALHMAWQTPEGGADWVARSSHSDDHPHPNENLQTLADEYVRILAQARAIAGTLDVKFSDSGCKRVKLFSEPKSALEEIRFVVDAFRLQTALKSKTSAANAFTSLSTKRVHKDVSFVRGHARAVVVEARDSQKPFIVLRNQPKTIGVDLVDLAKFATASIVDRGSFSLQDAIAVSNAEAKEVKGLLKILVRHGVLEYVPSKAETSSKGANAEL